MKSDKMCEECLAAKLKVSDLCSENEALRIEVQALKVQICLLLKCLEVANESVE